MKRLSKLPCLRPVHGVAKRKLDALDERWKILPDLTRLQFGYVDYALGWRSRFKVLGQLGNDEWVIYWQGHWLQSWSKRNQISKRQLTRVFVFAVLYLTSLTNSPLHVCYWLVFGALYCTRGISGHRTPSRRIEKEKAGRIGSTAGKRAQTSKNDGWKIFWPRQKNVIQKFPNLSNRKYHHEILRTNTLLTYLN